MLCRASPTYIGTGYGHAVANHTTTYAASIYHFHAALSRPPRPHQCAEKYTANVFPRMASSPATLPDLVKNSVPISSDSGFGLQGKSLPSGSSPTSDRPSVVITDPLSSKMTRAGIPRTLNLVLSDDFLSLQMP